MTYRISYGDQTTQSLKTAIQTEEFSTEQEALRRARELLDDTDQQTILV